MRFSNRWEIDSFDGTLQNRSVFSFEEIFHAIGQNTAQFHLELCHSNRGEGDRIIGLNDELQALQVKSGNLVK